MSRHAAYFIMTYEFLADALKLAYGMPDDVEILDMTIDHNPLVHPTMRTLLVKIEHPDLPEVLEGQQVPEARPSIHNTPDGPKFDWGQR